MSRQYHKEKIPKGEIGELSKIKEEYLELKDANAQGIRIMELVELSDMYGAMELYIAKYFPDMTMEDIRKMSDVTKNSFSTND